MLRGTILVAFLSLIHCLTLFAQCPNDNTEQQPPVLHVLSCSNSNNNFAQFLLPGEYVRVAVTADHNYTFTTCEVFDPYDSNLTLYDDATGNFLAYNDDYCGLHAQVSWLATFTGVIRVVLDAYSCDVTDYDVDIDGFCEAPVCANDNSQYPTNHESVVTCGLDWVRLDDFFGYDLYPGEFRRVNVTDGNSYSFRLCDGQAYATHFSLRDTNGNLLDYETDYCGEQMEVSWDADFTGLIDLHFDLANCDHLTGISFYPEVKCESTTCGIPIIECNDQWFSGTTIGATDDRGLATYNSSINCYDGTEPYDAPDNIYAFEVTESRDITVYIRILYNVDLDVFIISGCDTANDFCRIGSTEDNLISGINVESVSRILSPGTYYVVVDGPQANQAGAYELKLSCACDCTENLNTNLPFGRTRVCENFENYEQNNISAQGNRWTSCTSPTNDGLVAPFGTGQALKMDGSNPTDLYFEFAELEDYRARLSWDMLVDVGSSAAYSVTHYTPNCSSSNTIDWAYHVYFKTDGTGELRLANDNTLTVADFTYRNGEVTNVMQIMHPTERVGELWIDHNFVYSWDIQTATGFDRDYIDGVHFISTPGDSYYVDNICLWETKRGIESSCNTEDIFCTKSNAAYKCEASAGAIGLYTEDERGACYSICDQGGALINLGDYFTDTLMSDDIAPPLLLLEPCILDAYGGSLPSSTMYADIYVMYYNQSEGELLPNNIMNNTTNDTKYFMFKCECSGGDCETICVGEVNSDLCDGTPECEVDGFYYFVVLSPILDSYGFIIFPDSPCTVDTQETIDCNSAISSTVAITENDYDATSSGDYASCSNSGRVYEGSDRVYRLDLSQNTILSITLDADEAMGAFLYDQYCAENCLAAIENPDTGGSVTNDSITLSEGVYYIIVDKNVAGGNENFNLGVSCLSDSNFIYDVWGTDIDEDCPVNENNYHTMGIYNSAFNFSDKHLVTFGVYDGGLLRPIEGQNRFWNGDDIVVFNLPEDGIGGDKCGYIDGDSLVLFVYDTSEGNLSGGACDLQFYGTSDQINFTVGEADVINNITYTELDHFTVKPSFFSASSSGPIKTIVISTDQEWSIDIDPAYDWLDVNLFSGEGPTAVTLDVSPNDLPIPREAEIDVVFASVPPVTRSITVQQLPDCTVLPNIGILDSPSDQICEGESVDLEVVDPDDWQETVYLYNWSSNVIGSGANVTVTPGASTIYSVTVTNKYCLEQPATQLSIDITVFDSPIADAGSAMQLNCNNTSLTLNGTGSSPASGGSLSYLWTGPGITGGANTSSPTVNLSGQYNLTITESPSGCTAASSVMVTEVTPPTVSISSSTNLLCFEDGSGQATAFIIGGQSPFTYSWSNGEITQTATNLSAGQSNVIVTDAIGCAATVNINLTEPADLSVSGTSSGANCGENNGSIDISVTGGTGSYTFLWSPGGSTDEDPSNLGAGNYTVQVTDAAGCTGTESISVNANSGPNPATTFSDVTCFGLANGAIDLTVSGGVPPITFAWSNGSTTEDITGLVPNTYSVTITDGAGCEVFASEVIDQPQAMVVTGSASPANCTSPTGSVTVAVQQGTPPYSFLWSNGAITQSIQNLLADTYMVTVTDDNGCEMMGSYVVNSISNLAASGIPTAASCFGEADGSINLTVSGGNGIFSFSWSNGAMVEDPQGLAANTYTVTVTDGDGCISIASFVINQPEQIQLSTSAENACFDECNGSVDLSASGGSGPYSYAIGGGDINNLCAGTYDVTVTDNVGCTAVTTNAFSISEEPEIIVSLDTVLPETQNVALGSVDITITGGVAPYNVSWVLGGSVASTDEDPDDLVMGVYTLVVTDANDCELIFGEVIIDFVSGVNSPVQIPIAIDVIPNPTNGKFLLQFSQQVFDPIEVSIQDVLGRTVYSQNRQLGTNGNMDFDLENYTAGVYFVQLSFSGKTITKRVVVQ